MQACLILNILLKVLVLGLRCAISLRNSKECFFGCIGYVSGFDSPNISILIANSSYFWFFPELLTKSPSTLKEEPVFILSIIFSSKVFISRTT